MGRYIARRLLQAVVVFFGVTMLIYGSVFLLPGNPIEALSPHRPLPPNVVAQLRQQYDLNAPVWAQYGRYIADLFRGNLGTDFYGRSVLGLIGQRWPITLRLAATGWLFEIVIGVGLGVWAGVRRHQLSDRAILVLGVTVISVPAFVLAFSAQLLLGVKWRIFPVAGVQDGWPGSYVLPGFILGAFGLASVSRLVRSSVIESLRSDYVRTALAKGLSSKRILVHHVLRNSLIPAVTYLGLDLGSLLGGTIIIEGIFNLPGVGQLLFTGIQEQNGPLVVGVATMLVLVFVLLNLVVDLLYGLLDPRIRYE